LRSQIELAKIAKFASKRYVQAIIVILVTLVAILSPTMLKVLAPSGATIVTLGNEERQDITAANQWVEGNLHQWLEGQLYDAAVRWDAGTTTTSLPNTVDISYSFFFPAQNAVVGDWV
jgi:hypothetical protein